MVDTSEPLKRKADILLTSSSAFSDKLIHSRNTYLLSCYTHLHLIALQQHGTTSTHVIISVTSFTWTLMHCTYTTQHWYNIYVKKQSLSSAVWTSTTTNNHCRLHDIHPHYRSNSPFASSLQGACCVNVQPTLEKFSELWFCIWRNIQCHVISRYDQLQVRCVSIRFFF